LAARVRGALCAELVTEQRMFGGIAFLLGGNMLCCASRKGLMVRIARDREPEALTRPFAGPCLGTGRPMAGFIMVEPPGVVGDDDLAEWLDMARAYVTTLPAKSAKVARVKSGSRSARAVG
jgi:hypothetical protein